MAPIIWLRDESSRPSTNTSATSIPHFDLSEDRAPAILTFTGVVTALALIIVALRVYIRRFVLKAIGADDIVMILAVIAGICNYICFIGETTHGLGRHFPAISPRDMLQLAKWQFMHSWLILLCASLVKISVCLLLLRLVTRPIYRWSLWAIGIFIAVYNTICIGTIVFACIPVAANWDPSLLPTATCFSINTYRNLGILNSAVAMFTDVLLVVLPAPIIYSLHIERRAKIALTCIMSLGLIAVAAGAAKTSAQFTFLADPDRYYQDRFFVWAAVESCFGMMCASMPTLRPLLASCGGKIRRTYNNSSISRRRTSPSASAATTHASSNRLSGRDLEKSLQPIVSVDEIHPDSPGSKDSRSSVLSTLRRKASVDDAHGQGVQMVPLAASPVSGIMRTKCVTTISEPADEGLSAAFPIYEPSTSQLDRQSSARGLPFRTHRSSQENQDIRAMPRSRSAALEHIGPDSSSESELIHAR